VASYESILWINQDYSRPDTRIHLDDYVLSRLITRGGQLNSLKLQTCPLVSNMGLRPGYPYFKALKILKIIDCLNLTYDQITEIVKIPESLVQLDLNSTNVNDYAIVEITNSSYSTTLRTLSIRASTLISDDAVIPMLAACTNLTDLDISWCSELGNKTMEAIIQNQKGLEILNLRWCRKITQIGLTNLSLGCPKLKYLNLSGVGKMLKFADELRDDAIIELRKLTNLTYLDLSGQTFITPDSVAGLNESLKKLKKFVHPTEKPPPPNEDNMIGYLTTGLRFGSQKAEAAGLVDDDMGVEETAGEVTASDAMEDIDKLFK